MDQRAWLLNAGEASPLRLATAAAPRGDSHCDGLRWAAAPGHEGGDLLHTVFGSFRPLGFLQVGSRHIEARPPCVSGVIRSCHSARLRLEDAMLRHGRIRSSQ